MEDDDKNNQKNSSNDNDNDSNNSNYNRNEEHCKPEYAASRDHAMEAPGEEDSVPPSTCSEPEAVGHGAPIGSTPSSGDHDDRGRINEDGISPVEAVDDDDDTGRPEQRDPLLSLGADVASALDADLEKQGGVGVTDTSMMQQEIRDIVLTEPIEEEQLQPQMMRPMSPPAPGPPLGAATDGLQSGAQLDSQAGDQQAQEDGPNPHDQFTADLGSSGEHNVNASAERQEFQYEQFVQQQQQQQQQQQTSPQWSDGQHRPYAQHGPLDSSTLGNLRNVMQNQRPASRVYSYPTDADGDSTAAEIDEFYSYVEAPQVGENRAAWEEWCAYENKDAGPSRAGHAVDESPVPQFGDALGLGLEGDAPPPSSQDTQDKSLSEWTTLPTSARRRKIQSLLTLLEVKDPETRQRTSRALLYLLQGSFADTHGTEHQLSWIMENARMVRAAGGLGEIYAAFKLASWKHDWLSSLPDNISSSEPHAEGEPVAEPLMTWQMKLEYLDEINLELALHFAQLYLLVETQRSEEEWGDELMSLDPPLPIYLFTLVASLREKNAKGYPVKKLLLLLWKCLLACFGGIKDVKRCKELARELEGLPPMSDVKEQKSRPIVTKATPIDFQSFQDELAVKYPTYEPPRQTPGDLPLDKIASAVSPIPPRKGTGQDNGNTGINTGGFTATPAPSPPPSPRPNKQKYQTDQNRPFVFPYSRSVQGSRMVPYSIEEASRLYRNNMYVSLELWQLWRLREEAIHEESGVASAADGSRLGFGAWDKELHRQEVLASMAEASSQDSRSPVASEAPPSSRSTTGAGLSGQTFKMRGEPTLDRLEAIERELDAELIRAESDHMLAVIDNEKYLNNLSHLQEKRADTRRLQRVDILYRAVLPHLQNSIIVLLKLLLATVTQQNNSNSPYFQALADGIAVEDAPPPTLEDIDIVRHREITSKGVSGILLLLLKWFKVSHVMKFNFISQLLVDSNCLLLILKMFGLTEINNQVKVVNEIPNFNFFKFCELNCGQEPRKPRPEDTVLAKQPFEGLPSPPLALANLNSSVEEVVYMDRYSFRNFFAGLNFTRILQKLTKRKIHRILLLVQYKSSAILKRTLKVPHPDLQLYALKVIKSQVPFCGRKWRQSNMKVITAIYLRCRPDLRDEWLSGADVDGDVEESLPQEQALRSLIKYYNQTRIGLPSALPSPAAGAGHAHRRSLSTGLAGQLPDGLAPDGMGPGAMANSNDLTEALLSPIAHTRANLSFFESETLPPLRRAPETTAGTRRYIPDDLLEGYLDDYEDLMGELFGDSGEGFDTGASALREDEALHGLSPEGSRAAWGVLNHMLGEGDSISDSESVGSVGLMGHASDQEGGAGSLGTNFTSEGDDGAQTWERLSPEAMKFLTSNRPATPGKMRRRTSHGSEDGGSGGAAGNVHGTDLVGSPGLDSPLRPVPGPLDDDGEIGRGVVLGVDEEDLGNDDDDDASDEPLPEPTAGGIDEVEHVWGA